uniref:Alanine racemase n=1 Tax=Rhabditophanes sp. KR3021 TaxID=114890 RepID=A0AC35THX6_9BILA
MLLASTIDAFDFGLQRVYVCGRIVCSGNKKWTGSGHAYLYEDYKVMPNILMGDTQIINGEFCVDGMLFELAPLRPYIQLESVCGIERIKFFLKKGKHFDGTKKSKTATYYYSLFDEIFG